MQSSSCAICISLLDKNDDIFSTVCGHVFHMPCLTQWLERSKNCPQCREKLSNSKIFRLYFNFNNNDSIREDSATLQQRVDNMQFQLDLRDNTIRTEREKYEDMLKQRNSLRKEVLKYENEITKKNSAIYGLTEQAKYLKEVAKDTDIYKAKFDSLKAKIDEYQAVEKLIFASRDEAAEVAANAQDRQQLVVYVAALKRQLEVECHRRKDLREAVKTLTADKKKLEAEKANLQSKLKSQREMEQLLENFEEENRKLREQLAKKLQSRQEEDGARGLERVRQDSPDFSFGSPKSPEFSVQPARSRQLAKQLSKGKFDVDDDDDDENSALATFGRYKITNVKDDSSKLRSQPLPKTSILSKKRRLADDPTARTTAIDDRFVPDGLGGYMKVEEFPVTNKNRKITPPAKKTLKRKIDNGKNQKMDSFIDLT